MRSNSYRGNPRPSEPFLFHVETLESRCLLSTVQVLAAGFEGEEIIELQIDEQAVQTWNLNSEASNRSFEVLVYETPETISADQVRLQFVNDRYRPAEGIDRNVLIDSVTIDGVQYQTESPEVFSTGTWKAADGIQPGFRESEILHTNGYFQFATTNPTGSTVEVRARGNEGVEQFNLSIAGSVVRTIAVTTSHSIYTFVADSTVTAEDVRIDFLNDVYNPDLGIDNNLIIDWIRIDGQTYQTENSDVFSTGTWLSSDGIQPGFRQSETLHTEGYFQFGAGGNVDGGDVRLVTNAYSVAESDGFVTIEAIRENGSDGFVSVDFSVIGDTAVAGQDFENVTGTIVWNDGESGVRSFTIPILDDGSIEGEERFNVTIDNAVGPLTLLAPRTATVTIDDNDSVASTGDGLLGEYFDGLGFLDLYAVRTDATVDFDWGNGEPITGIGADNFSVRWSGQVEPIYSEEYTFVTRSDDGIRLWVNDLLLIDQFIDQSATTHTGTIALEAGVLYDISIEYYERGGQAVMELSWQSDSQTLEVIPQSQLYAADAPVLPPTGDLITETLINGLNNPTSLEWSPDGRNLYVSQKDGLVFTVRDGVQQTTPFIDIRNMVNGVRDRGLLDLAVHPDFENTPYVYLLFTYDPPEVFGFTGLAGPDGRGNRAGRLIRVTADPSNQYKTAIPGSEVVLLGTNSTWENFNGFVNSTNDFDEPPAGINPDGTNIQDFVASDSESHTVGAIEFGIDGNLFVSIGDGTSYNARDPRTVRVQDIDNLSGKILRIDPITGEGLADNPFYNGEPNANRSKVYQYGLRNPFRITVDPVSGQLYVGDVGWTRWEEINAAGPGANFGWPFYEGGSGQNLPTRLYEDLPEAQAFYNSGAEATPAIFALNHNDTGINAIILGDVYTGSTYPEQYVGDLFFNDLGQGIVRNVSFDTQGNITSVDTFSTGAQIVVHIQQGPDGNLYFIDLNDGQVGRWVFN